MSTATISIYKISSDADDKSDYFKVYLGEKEELIGRIIRNEDEVALFPVCTKRKSSHAPNVKFRNNFYYMGYFMLENYRIDAMIQLPEVINYILPEGYVDATMSVRAAKVY